MTARGKVALELGLIATLTTLFILVFPKRSPVVDISLAGLALIGVGVSAGYTRAVIWAETPPPVANDPLKRCMIITLWITVPTVLLFVLAGTILGYRNGGWPAVVERMFNWKILAAFGGYLLWALMQQTLFQFYLLGRLLVLFPKGKPIVPVVITGICYSLVHWPDVWTMAATAAAGVVWTLIYYRYRQLLPLAFSHAALGTAFYYGLFGHDLAVEWRSVFPGN
jgi:membrane protease YdiL (CAAX protease family)